MKSNSTISIALATYNGGAFLQEQLDSLASQFLLPMELVVSDDGSDDQTLDIVLNFSKTSPFPVKLVQNRERLGYGANFLNAASICKGTHVAFCDQDDVWLPHKISRLSAIFQKGSFDMVAHSARVVDRHLNWLDANFPDILVDTPLNEAKINSDFFWPGFSLTISQSFFSDVNSASFSVLEKTKFAHDELICDLACNRSCYLISEPLALYRQHGNNLIGFHGAMFSRTDFLKKA